MEDITDVFALLLGSPSYLNKNREHTPKYFYTGNRKAQILHTRLRTNCSSLNLDLFLKNIADTPHCNCGTGSIEDQQHYFFHCPNFQLQRAQLFNAISMYQAPTLHLLLHGDLGLSTETNKTILKTFISLFWKQSVSPECHTVNVFTLCCKYYFILTNKKLYACSQPCRSSIGKP